MNQVAYQTQPQIQPQVNTASPAAQVLTQPQQYSQQALELMAQQGYPSPTTSPNYLPQTPLLPLATQLGINPLTNLAPTPQATTPWQLQQLSQSPMMGQMPTGLPVSQNVQQAINVDEPSANVPRRRKDLNKPSTSQIEQRYGRNAAEILNERLIELEDSYGKALEWIKLQQQKEPIVQNLAQEYMKVTSILQTPQYLAEYHDRFFNEVVEVPQRNVQLYRNLLTDPNLLAQYVRYFYENVRPDLVQKVDAEKAQLQGQPQQLQVDFNQSLLQYQLTPQQISELKKQLVVLFQQNKISEQNYFSRLRELEVINDPARQSMIQTRVTQPQQGFIQQQQPQMTQPQPQQQPMVPPSTVEEARQQAAQQRQGFQESAAQRPAFPSMPAQSANNSPQAGVQISALPPWQQYQVAQNLMRSGAYQLAN